MEELKELQQKAKRSLIISIAVIAVIGIFVFLSKPDYAGFVVVLIVIPIVIFVSLNSKFTKLFKETFVVKALESVFTNLHYDPTRGLDRNIIANTGMLWMGNTYSSNDYISGTYKDVDFVQSDVKIQDVTTYTDSDGHTHTDTTNILIGKWMIFDFNKTFKANVQVKSKFFSHTKLSIKMGESRYKEVKMEDVDFNKKFSVHAQDEHDAFYILTPQLMEKIKALSEDLKGKIMLCFIDNKLHVALNNSKDSFEYSIFSKIDEQIINDYVAREIKVITDFIDKLSLDNDIFKN